MADWSQPSMNTNAFSLSILVVPVGGPPFVHRCLTALTRQAQNHDAEMVVPYEAQAAGYDRLAEDFPQVKFLPVTGRDAQPHRWRYAAQHEVYDTLKTRGLCACTGSVVALLEDTVIPGRDWLAQVLAAHELPHGVIGGALEHVGRGPLNWAVYLMDFGRYSPPLAEGPQTALTDVNVTYKSAVLDANRDLWDHRYHEVELHTGLLKRGAVLWLKPQILVHQDRGQLLFRETMRERFEWGWVYGAKRATLVQPFTRVALLLLSPAIPLVRLARLTRKMLANRHHRRQFVLALPWILALTLAWTCGEITGYLRPKLEGLFADELPAAIPSPEEDNHAKEIPHST